MNLKLSYYVVITDPINQLGQRVIFSTRTSKTFLISSIYWNYLQQNKLHLIPNEMIEKFKLAEILVDQQEIELQTIVEENIEKSTQKKGLLYEVIQPTAMCQLGCDYCGQNHTKDYISKSMFESLLNRIENKLRDGDYQALKIGWFGGEPLMGLPQMRELSNLLIDLSRKYDVVYSSKIVTNGLSLKPAIFDELIEKHHVNHIEVTLDGTAEFHDVHRPTKRNEKTFDIILQNLIEITHDPNFKEKNCDISIRCNVDHRNVESVTPLIHLLKEKNLHNKISHFYPIGIYSWGGNNAHEKSLTKEEFAEREIDWYIELISAGFNVNLLPGRVKQVCMAVSNVSEMYDAFGNIFNCTEVSYVDIYDDSTYRNGKLNSNDVKGWENRRHSDWNQSLLDDSFPCHTCKMLPVCGGSCPKSWHEDMRACPSSKFNIKDKLALAYVASKSDVSELLEQVD